MAVPPPYDPVLLREHAFHDTGLKSLVIPSNSGDGAFHSATENGLGIFHYKFAQNFEIHHIDNTVKIIRWIALLVVFAVCYMAFSYHYSSKHTRTSRVHSISSTMIATDALMAPFAYKKKSSSDIESQDADYDDDNLQNTRVPDLSDSAASTPRTPDQFRITRPNNREFIDNGVLLKYIENDKTYVQRRTSGIY